MAGSIKGITIEIAGNTVGLQKALSDVNKQSKGLQSELTAVNRLLKFDPGNAEGIAQKQALLAKQVENTTKKLGQLKDAQAQVDAQFASGKIDESQYNAFRREIEFTEGSLKKLTTEMSALQQEQEHSAKSTKQLSILFEATGKSIDDYANSLGSGLVNAIKNGTATSEQLDTAITKIGQEALGTSVDIDKMKQALSQVDDGASLNSVKKDLEVLSKEADIAKKSVGDLGSKLEKTGSNMESAGQGIATSFGAGAAAIGTGLGLALNKSMEFEAQLSRVGAIAGSTDTELQALRESALSLGASTSKSATEIAVGQEALAALGFTTKDILGAMPGVISAAEASGSDMAQTAEVMASTMNIFGIEAGKAAKVADILAKTANVSAADLTDMQYALKYAGPPAAALGISLEELAGSIGIMTNAGMEGEQAGTTLRGALLGLLSPSEANSKMMETMGIQITDASGKFVGISKLVENLSKSMEGQTDTQKAATLATLVGNEAVSGMLSLMASGPEEIDKMTNALQNSGGASADAAAKMKDNLKGTLDELSGSIETMAISIGTALTPAAEAIAAAIQKITDGFNDLSPGMQSFIATGAAVSAIILGLVATFGVMLAVIGSAITGLGAIATALGVAGGAAGLFSAALAVITGPIGLVIAAIVGLIAVGVLLYQNWDTVKTYAASIWGAIGGNFKDAIEQIKGYVKTGMEFVKSTTASVLNSVSAFVKGILGKLSAFWRENGEDIKKIVQSYLKAIGSIVSAGLSVVKGVFQVTMPIITGVVKTAWALMQGVFKVGLDVILGAVQFFLKVLKGDWSGALQTLVSTAKSIIANVVSVFKSINLASVGKNIIQGLINGIKSMASGVLGAVKAIAHSVSSTIKSVLDIHSPSKVTHKLGEHTGQGFADGISSKKKEVEKAAKEAAAAAKKAFNEQMDKAEYKFKMGKIDFSQYIALLKTIRDEYAKTPEQIRKVNLEIKSIQDKHSKEIQAMQKKEFNEALKTIKDKAAAGKISAEQELKQLQDLSTHYKKNSNERLQIDKEIKKVKDKLLKEQFDDEKAYIDNKKYYNQLSLSEELAEYEKYVKKYKKGSDERIFYEKEIYRVKKEIQAQVDKINEDYLTKVKTLNQELIDGEKKLNDEYNKALEDRAKSLYSFAGIFDEVVSKDVSGDQLLKNLQSQVSAFEDWQNNISNLANRGIGDELLKELRDLGPKAGDEIAALTTLTDEQLQEYQNLWGEKNKLAKDEAMKELEPLKAETLAKIEELKKETADKLLGYQEEWRKAMADAKGAVKNELKEMPNIGQFAVAGLIDGLLAKKQALISTAKSMAKAVKDTFADALDIHSPSRVFKGFGININEGLIQGIKESSSRLNSATTKMAQATIPTIDNLNFPSSSAAPTGGTQNITIMLDREVIGRAVAPTVAREITVRAWR